MGSPVPTAVRQMDPDLDAGKPGTYDILITLKDMRPGDRYRDLYKASTWSKHFQEKFVGVTVTKARPAVRYRDGVDTFTGQRGGLPSADAPVTEKLLRLWEAATGQDWFNMHIVLTVKVEPGAGERDGNARTAGMGIAFAAGVALAWSIIKIVGVVLFAASLLYAFFSDHGMVILEKVLDKVLYVAKRITTGLVDAAQPIMDQGLKNIVIVVGIGAVVLYALSKSKSRVSTPFFGIGGG